MYFLKFQMESDFLIVILEKNVTKWVKGCQTMKWKQFYDSDC